MAVFTNGAGGNRTHKECHLRRILSPLRLPVPPQPLAVNSTQNDGLVKVFDVL